MLKKDIFLIEMQYFWINLLLPYFEGHIMLLLNSEFGSQIQSKYLKIITFLKYVKKPNGLKMNHKTEASLKYHTFSY